LTGVAAIVDNVGSGDAFEVVTGQADAQFCVGLGDQSD
jgi:hypothetical protein